MIIHHCRVLASVLLRSSNPTPATACPVHACAADTQKSLCVL